MVLHAGEPLIQALVKIRQQPMVQPHQVQDRRVQVGDVAWLLDRAEAELVGGADGLAALDARAGEPDAEAEWVVIAARADAKLELLGGLAARLSADSQGKLVAQLLASLKPDGRRKLEAAMRSRSKAS